MKLTKNVDLAPVPLTFPRFTIAALDDGSGQTDIAIWDTTQSKWSVISRDSLASLLNVGGATPDSVLFPYETTGWDKDASNDVTSNTLQNITAQKNFLGNLKAGSDTSITLQQGQIKIQKPSAVWAYAYQLDPYYTGRVGNWGWQTIENVELAGNHDTIPVWGVIKIGYNNDNAVTSDVRAGLVFETNYWINYANPEQPRHYDTEIYFAWTDTNDLANEVRPFAMNIRRGTGVSQVGIATEEFYISNRARANFIRIRPDENSFEILDTLLISYSINNHSLFRLSGNPTSLPVYPFKVDELNNLYLYPGNGDMWTRGIKMGGSLLGETDSTAVRIGFQSATASGLAFLSGGGYSGGGFYYTGATKTFGVIAHTLDYEPNTWASQWIGNYRANFFAGGNVGVGTYYFESGSTATLMLGEGTAPDNGVANTIQIYSSDLATDNTIPSFYTEGTGVVQDVTLTSPNKVIAIRVNGTVYYLQAKLTAD